MTNTASETGREGLVGEAASQMEDAAATAQQKASELKEQGRSKLSETLDQRTTQAGGQARQMAQALRRSGEQLREQGEGQQAAGVTEGAAERIERLGGYLQRSSGDELLRDAATNWRWALSGRALVGWMLVGWGLFNLVEGVLDHHILTIHHVREGAGVNESAWDVAFLLFGAFLVIGGWLLARSNQSVSNPN